MSGKRKRLLQHIPVGLVNAVMFGVWPELGVLFGLGFMGYEVLQSRGCEWTDKGHYDVVGWIWGLGIGGGLACLYACIFGAW